MQLVDIVKNIDNYDDELTIYIAKPWQVESKAVVAMEPSEGGLPQNVKENNLEYFLEVFVVLEFLDGWKQSEGQSSSIEETCKRLIQYAINDA